ncbi:MAG: NAD(P)/FAD-dependent oxidoreductase [Bacteroidota bacterium]
MEKYDLVIIGAGPSGYAGAMRALDFNKRVLLIEKEKLGGAGIFNGALWSKSMWEYSEKVKIRRDAGEGRELNITWQSMMKDVNEAIHERKMQMTLHLNILQSEHTNTFGIHYQKGTAVLQDSHHVVIHKNDGKIKIVEADKILLCTGSHPRKLAHLPIDEKIVVTSDGINNWTDFPESLVILGAGVIGCEFATIFSNIGKTKVYLIDKAPRILPFEDEDIAQMVTENLELNGVTIHKNSSLVRMEIKDGKVEYELKYDDGKIEIIYVSNALISVGRIPNTENLGMENTKIKFSERGSIIDHDTQTDEENIYVAGDLTAEISLVTVGEREARHAVRKMFGGYIETLKYRNLCTIMFLNPEVAVVGMSEQEAVQKGISVKVAKIDFSCIARAVAMRKTKGFFKIIVSNDDEMKILGMRAIGEHASSAIQAVQLLIYMNKGIDELAHMIYPHPSIIEGIQECVRMLLKKSIYKSSVLKDKLKCYVCENGTCTPINNL